MARLRVPLPSRLPAARDPLSFSRTRCVRSSDTEHGASKRVEAERDLAALAPLTAGNRVAESVLSAHKASRQCTSEDLARRFEHAIQGTGRSRDGETTIERSTGCRRSEVKAVAPILTTPESRSRERALSHVVAAGLQLIGKPA